MTTIPPNEIHLWCTYDNEVSDKSLLSKYRSILSSEERLQQERFYFSRDRHQYLITRALTRTVLSQYIPDVSPNELTFTRNKYGKPYISNLSLPVEINFNISHSRKLVVLAVTNKIKVGVDVEHIARDGNILSIIDRFFSLNEATELRSLEKHKQTDRFFDLWTLKEAYIKARSMGLSIPLNKFSYKLDNDSIKIFFDEKHIIDKADNWKFWQLMPSPDHKMSIAVTDNNIKNKNYLLRIKEVVPLVSSSIVDYPIIRTG